MELPALHLALYVGEMRGNQTHTAGITYKYHLVGELFGLEMQMEHAPVLIEDKF